MSIKCVTNFSLPNVEKEAIFSENFPYSNVKFFCLYNKLDQDEFKINVLWAKQLPGSLVGKKKPHGKFSDWVGMVLSISGTGATI